MRLKMATIDKIKTNKVHPIYTQMAGYWQFWGDTYLGAYNYVKNVQAQWKRNSDNELVLIDDPEGSYLIPNKRELSIPGHFQSRHLRSFFINHTSDAVNRLVKYIFSGANRPSREYSKGNLKLEDYIQNVDGENTTIDSFMSKKVAVNGLVYGSANILLKMSDVDPDIIVKPTDALTRQDQDNLGMRVFWQYLPIMNILDWDKTNGIYDWVKIKVVEDAATPWTDRKPVTNYLVYTQDAIYQYDESGQIVEEFPNNFAPLIPIFEYMPMDTDDNGIAESYVQNLAPIDREIYNKLSEYCQGVASANFPMLAIPTGSVPGRDNIQVGADTVLEYSGEILPVWLQPTTMNFQEIREYVNYLIDEFMRVSNMDKTNIDMTQAQSGLSKLVSFQDTDAFISEKAQGLGQFENLLWKITMKQEGLKDDTIVAVYPEDFNVQNENARIDFLKKAKDMFAGFTHAQIYVLGETLKLFKDVPKKVVKSVEDGALEMEARKEALDLIAQNAANQENNQNTENPQDDSQRQNPPDTEKKS